MKREKQALNAPKKVPLLEEVTREKIRFEAHRAHRKNRWYRIYFATAGTALFLAVVVLFLGFSEGKSGFLSSLSTGLIRLEFMDLSGKEKPTEKNEESSEEDSQDVWLPIEKPSPDTSKDEKPNKTPMTFDQLYSFDYGAVPKGELPILPKDLSLSSYGAGYIQNFTGFSPDTEALLYGELRSEPSIEYLSKSDKPSVLILHTHGTEAYSPDGAISYVEGKESLRSENLEENVVSVGKVLADALEAKGISTIHCTVLHDRVQYKDSYARAEETIRAYLAEYPSIQLVIDLHRDAVIKSTGEMIRPVTLNEDGEATAQVMCVVGSSWNGQENEQWQRNLALALKLRAALNGTTKNLCRPPYLRGATYNQELAPYSLLIEIGACGNSLAEAKRAAVLIADALVDLIPKM